MFYVVEGERVCVLDTYFSKGLSEVLREAVVKDWIRYTHIRVSQHMAEYLYGDRNTCCFVHLKRFQHEAICKDKKSSAVKPENDIHDL